MLTTNYDHLGQVSAADWDAYNWVGRLVHVAGVVAREQRLKVSFRCHSVSRALAELNRERGNPHGLRVVDGAITSAVVTNASHVFEEVHTWLALPSGAIVDPYPPAVTLSPLLLPKPVGVGMGHAFWHCYRPGKFRKGQEAYLRSTALKDEAAKLVELFAKAEERARSFFVVENAA